MRVVLCAAALSLLSCSGEVVKESEDGGARRRRVLGPLPERVRAMPPHAIHSEGVGPYVLGASLERILGLLPHGPRVELVQLDAIGDYSLVRTEEQRITVGVVRPEGARFIAVTDKEIAHTEHGVGVGTTRHELEATLGQQMESPVLAADPRVLRFEELPGVRFVLSEKGVVSAAVVSRSSAVPQDSQRECRLSLFRGARERLKRAAKVGRRASLAVGCLGPTRVMALVAGGGRVAALAPDGARLRKLWQLRTPGVTFAAPLDTDADGRDEVAVVRETLVGKAKVLNLTIYRVDEGRAAPIAQSEVYRLSEAALSFAGARSDEVSFLAELSARDGVVDVEGLLLHGRGGRAVSVLPLKRRSIPLLRKRPSGRQRPQLDSGEPADKAIGP